MPGATAADKRRAAQIMFEQGKKADWIAVVLREDTNKVSRWIAERDKPDLCRNGMHEMTEENIKWYRDTAKCLACHRDWKRRARAKYREGKQQ